MRRFTGKSAQQTPAGMEPAPANIGKQVGVKVTVSLIAEAVKRFLDDLGYPWWF